MKKVAYAVAVALLPGSPLWADGAAAPASLEEVVVTTPMMADPFTVVTDPLAPRQPVPASDGGSYLKNIPGFSLSRKGGTDGDPALRGLGGSRLNILLDDSYILGGCGQRMDPPTAYVYPESYDRITVLKGPQSVRFGASVAGTVRFERETEHFAEPGMRGSGSLLFGSFGRNDQRFDLAGGNANGYLRAIGTRSDADNYKDGDGDEVHSFYTRWSGTALLGWTPDADTRVELSYDASDGEAAYADRTKDGVEFDREGYGIEVSRANLSPVVENVEFKAYRNYVDHVMDNFSLRDPAGMKSVMNPDRLTRGARAEARLRAGEVTAVTFGADYQENAHTARMAMAMAMAPDPDIDAKSRMDKASFEQLGIFGEVEHDLGLSDRLVAGLRLDDTEATAEQMASMMDPDAYGGADPGDTDDDSNTSGFLRWEHDMAASPSVVYAGVGRAERSPDFWERDRVFGLDSERTTQLDLGWTYRGARTRATVSVYYADIADYIQLTDNGSSAENIDATTYGGEADMSYRMTDTWRLNATLAYVHGENDTDGDPLAQMPPLEGTLGVNYDDGTFSGGVLLRAVDEQDRVDVGSGTIYGTDIGETPGFAVLSVNGGYRPRDGVVLTAGIDNLLDKTYAEHIAKGSADAGTVTGRVNEPGRNYWLKATARF